MTNHNISSKTKRHIRKLKGDRCERCEIPNGNSKIPEERLQIHHKVPRWKGGSNRISNLELVCQKCHDWAHIEYRKKRMKKIKGIWDKLMKTGEWTCHDKL